MNLESGQGVPDFEKVAQWLYSVLDDIDSASDYAKNDDVRFRETVERLQRLKNEVGRSIDGYSVIFRSPLRDYGLTRLWDTREPTPWD